MDKQRFLTLSPQLSSYANNHWQSFNRIDTGIYGIFQDCYIDCFEAF